MRLLQKTGPVWPQLAPQTCQDLLVVFIKHVRVRRDAVWAIVARLNFCQQGTCDGPHACRCAASQDGVMLHRVLPWLWRLADEDAGRPEVPPPLQQQLLAALNGCPAAEDPQVCCL